MAGGEVDLAMCGRHGEAIVELKRRQKEQNGSIDEVRDDFKAFTADYTKDRLASLRASRNTLIGVLLNLVGVIVTLGLIILEGRAVRP